jgi:membrane-associated PAP2 superfamily phosphatase
VAVVIGLLGGLCAVGFREFIQVVNRIAWHRGPYALEYIAGLPWWWKVLAPAAGGSAPGSCWPSSSHRASASGRAAR